MIMTLIILGAYVAGIALGALAPALADQTSAATQPALMLLVFLVGIGTALDPSAWARLRSAGPRAIAVPVAVILGTLGGAALVAPLLPGMSLPDVLAVASGFGWYSLSAVMIAEARGEVMGALALMANISREVITLVFAGLMVRAFGPLAPVASAGATAMDVSLGIITIHGGREAGLVALASGFAVSLATPVFVGFFLSL